MTDIFDKAILIGMGLEKKARETLEDLQKAGKTETAQPGSEEGPGLGPKQVVENRLVEEGVHVLKEFLSVVKAAKDKLEESVTESSEMLLSRLNVATTDEVDVVREMARISREKVEALEKRVKELETKLEKEG